MDPLTALSLAGNIIQFVDFGSKLLQKGHEIYNSVDGASIGNKELEAAAINLRELSGRLNASTVSRRARRDVGVTGTVPDVAIVQLSKNCLLVAAELLQVLDRLRVQGDSNRRWKSFRQALKSSLKQGRVNELNNRLQTLRQELSFNVLVSLREDLELQSLKSSAGFVQLERSTQTLVENLIHEQRRALSEQTIAFGARQDRTNEIVEAQHQQTRREIIKTIQNESIAQRRPKEEDDDDQHPAKIKLVSELILESLRFQTMDDRSEEIELAHQKTFGWVFAAPEQGKPWADFPEWLSLGTGIYWINGKAASGKSTLMKYAFNDHRTQSLLEKWAGHERLIKVSHYFWNSGTSDQRSHAGLLRGLLYKILCQCGFLIPEIFPDVWRDKITKPLFLIEEMGAVSWTLLKLSQAFDRLLSSQSRGLKFCLFVDGLDEYDGDYFEITQIFTRISASPNVKICVSSRPLSDFVFAFRACPSLRLQDLTSGDIQQYIDHELGNNAHMKVLREENPTMAQTLVSEIINKADGVFLWVKLVVLSLLRGLRQSDDMNDLQVRLNLLPPSLEDLFSHILGRLDPAYLEQSSRIFQIFAEAQKINDASLTSLELSFAEELDSKTVISEETRKLSTGELIARSSRVDIWLRTRCGGLIEMHSAEDDTGNQMLSYLHRTVRDFLELPEIWSIVLKPTIGKDFISSVALLQSQVLYIKWVLPFPSTLTARIYELQRVAKRALSFAKLAETANRTPQMAMLNELDRVCTDLIRGFVPDTYSWTTLENTIWADPDQNSLITLAITYGLYYYLEKKLKMEPWHMEKGGRPLLYYAVSDRNYLCGYRSGVDVYPDVVELLFRHGAKAGETYAVQIKHEVYETLSPWQLVLQSLFELLARPQTKEITRKWLSVVKLFLENGAEPTQCLHNDDSKTAYSLVHALSDEPHEVKALLLSPGILRERAEQERREQRAKDTAQAERVSAKRDCTQLKNDIAQDVVSSEAKSLSSYRDPSAEKALGDTSSSRAALPKEVPRTASASQQPFVEVSKSPSAEVSLPVSQTVTVSNLSSWSTRPRYELEADPPIPPNSEEFEISITSQIEAIALNSIPSYYGFESTSVLADRDFEYNRALETDFDILPWNLPLESRDCIAPSVASEQNWNHMQQYGISSQQVPKESELPPPIPPKIPLLLTVAPATQSPTIIQSPSQMRPSSAASRALPQWGARWNAIGPNVQESHDSLSPNDTTPWNNNDVSNPRPSSAYGIPAHSQPTLSHHRSYNSLSFTQNASGYQNRSTQQEYLPYRNPDKFQQQTNQSLSHTYTPPTQMSYERPSPAMLYIDTNYNAPVTPHESSNQQYFHHVKYPSYVTVQSTIPSPVSTTSPYSAPHQTRFQDTNTYQQLSPSYLSPQSSQDTQWSHFSHQVPDSSPPYSPAQYSAASPFSSRSGYGHDDGNVRMKEREQFNVEVTPVVENTRPMSWFGRFRKSSRT